MFFRLSFYVQEQKKKLRIGNMEISQVKLSKDKIGIVLVSFNNQADTLECLSSLQGLDGGPYHTYLVDNGSTDSTVKAVHTQFPDIEILPQSSFRLH